MLYEFVVTVIVIIITYLRSQVLLKKKTAPITNVEIGNRNLHIISKLLQNVLQHHSFVNYIHNI